MKVQNKNLKPVTKLLRKPGQELARTRPCNRPETLWFLVPRSYETVKLKTRKRREEKEKLETKGFNFVRKIKTPEPKVWIKS